MSGKNGRRECDTGYFLGYIDLVSKTFIWDFSLVRTTLAFN